MNLIVRHFQMQHEFRLLMGNSLGTNCKENEEIISKLQATGSSTTNDINKYNLYKENSHFSDTATPEACP